MPHIPLLKTVRLHLGWSQADLARKAVVDRSRISRCENGYFVNEVTCARIEIAIRAEAQTQKVSLDGFAIDPDGIPGPMPKKGRKRR